ncbi:hypothetical protein [Lysinibacillus parviboronicapiens]|uniref:hypothetical protein n=1 Tax=Lysinibacillus parviboronicapiens TaxID=436516 RepID=UPI000B1AEE88|nr:hypothetical protein [Lysinibacillus parviboronicapiens]
MSISVATTSTLPSGGELPGGWNDDAWDIDRWENDGGSSLSTRQAPGVTKKL